MLWRTEVKSPGSRAKLLGFCFWPCMTFSNHFIFLNYGFLIFKMGIKQVSICKNLDLSLIHTKHSVNYSHFLLLEKYWTVSRKIWVLFWPLLLRYLRDFLCPILFLHL